MSMIDYKALKEYNNSILKDDEVGIKQIRKFNTIHKEIHPKMTKLVDDFFNESFDSYVEETIKNHIKKSNKNSSLYQIPIDFEYSINFDNNGSLGIKNYKYINLIDEDNYDDSIDLFDYYYHIDRCTALDLFEDYFQNSILDNLRKNNLTIESSKLMSKWPYDTLMKVTLSVTFTIQL